MMPDLINDSRKSSLRALARLFLRLGFTAFGGPAAHVALMEAEVVRRLKWLSEEEFLDTVSAVNFIPGPNSTELAIHVGQLRAGFAGLVTAGVCFIAPAMLIVLPLAWAYTTYGAAHPSPAVIHALTGVKAATLAIVIHALIRFTRTGIKDRFTTVLALLALIASFLATHFTIPQSEILILALAAIAGMIYYRPRTPSKNSTTPVPTLLPQPAIPNPPSPHFPISLLPLAAIPSAFTAQLWTMSLFFLKVGATLFGSGYVLASFLHTGLVEQFHWLTEQELLDAIAVGQVTPGPLLTAATFIGYLLGHRNFGGGVPGGLIGGVAATVAIFLPSFLFVALLGKFLPRLRVNPYARGALDGMNAAVVALIATVTLWLGQSVLLNSATGQPALLPILLMLGSLIFLLTTKLNPTWTILAAALLGLLQLFFV